MDRSRFRTAYLLTAIIIGLMTVASAGGLFIDGLYRDNTWVSSQFRGSDLVRLAVAVPLLMGSLILTMRGSQRAQLVWLGMLWVTIYDYAFYLFGAAFNEFFLVYVALFALAILALIFALPRIDIQGISQQFRAQTPVKWITGYLVFWAVLMGGLWISQWLRFAITGDLPQSLLDAEMHTEIVYALDLSLMIPAVALGAALLWRRHHWGYVIAVMLNGKGIVYPLALIGMGVFARRAGVSEGDLIPLWLFFFLASLTATALLLGNMRPPGANQSRAVVPGEVRRALVKPRSTV